MRAVRRGLLVATLLLAACATSRDAAFADLQALDAQLLASSSATLTLERWCADRELPADPKIVAVRVQGAEKVPSREQLQRLGVSSASELRYRHVELRCGAHVLSEADNWYVPACLTPEMNALLDTTDTPFGKTVRPLQPYRKTLEAKLLWSGHTAIPRDVRRTIQ
jgi:chorismate-pyruvate lyase